MTDTEKAIKGIECCRRGFCFACPYNDGIDDNVDCKQKWADDVLALLKAKQPRVLTLDEVKASIGKDLILEYIPFGWEDSVVTAATMGGYGSKGVSFVMTVACDYTAYNRKHSLGWRCWNVRPTDAERKAVKWSE